MGPNKGVRANIVGDIVSGMLILSPAPVVTRRGGARVARRWRVMCECGLEVYKDGHLLRQNVKLGRMSRCSDKCPLQRGTLLQSGLEPNPIKKSQQDVQLLKELVHQVCTWCGAKPDGHSLNSLCKLEPSGPWTVGNTAVSCHRCSTMKSNRNKLDFLSHVKRIHDRHFSSADSRRDQGLF